jgi:hypothetical protein
MKKEGLDLSIETIRTSALEALLAVANDPLAPSAARAAASRTLLESIGAIGRLQDSRRLDETRAGAEMSPTEIAEEIARLSAKIPPPQLRQVRTPRPK